MATRAQSHTIEKRLNFTTTVGHHRNGGVRAIESELNTPKLRASKKRKTTSRAKVSSESVGRRIATAG